MGDEWIQHNGGKRPVPLDTPVEVRHRSGEEFADLTGAGIAAAQRMSRMG